MKNILLVDDSSTMLMTMETIIKNAGFSTKTANNANQALQIADSFKPDLVITDLNMPGMNGIELIRELKKKPALRFKPMLMLTTESRNDRRQEAKAAGATGWLVKPVKPEDLLAVIKQVLPGT